MAQKLKGIYDALDNGNYKSCLKLCTTFLQKQPGHHLCKALHAVALERCGRRDEALRLCDEVRSAAPGAAGTDDSVYNAVSVVYRRCRKVGDIVQLYEAACAADPENEEYGVALLVAMLREGEYAKAQQVATRLYSKHKRARHAMWIVVTLLHQARQDIAALPEGCGAAAPPSKSLDLAAIMLQKAPIDKDLLNGDGPITFNRTQLYLVLLHLDTLRLRGKFDDALDLLKTCEPIVKLPGDIAALRIRLLRDAGRTKEALEEAKKVLLKQPEDWGAAQECIRLAFECPAPAAAAASGFRHSSRVGGGDADGDEVCSMVALVQQLREDAEKTEKEAKDGGSAAGGVTEQRVRTARLAQLELWRMAFCADEAAAGASGWRAAVGDTDFGAFATAVEDYALRFVGSSNCFFDLKPFLALLGAAEVARFRKRLGEAELPKGGSAEKIASATVGRLTRALARRGGEAAAPPAPDASEVQCFLLGGSSSSSSAGGGGGGEQPPKQELAQLAIAALLDLDRAACRSGGASASSRACLVSALALAEEGLECDPHGFRLHFRVLLVLAYGLLGLPGPMLRNFSPMEVKNIQHESLSYLAFDALCLSGGTEQLREACGNIIGFHEDYDKDASEAVKGALQNGVFQRVTEYLDSLRAMGRSLLWARAVVEETLCEVGQAQTWDALVEGATRQRLILADVMRRGTDDWAVRNQDRRLLNGMHPLPSCSPLAAAREVSAAWAGGGGAGGGAAAASLSALPTISLQSAWSGAVGSSGLRWVPCTAAAATDNGEAVASASAAAAAPFHPPPRRASGGGGGAAAAVGQPELSAAEELLLAGSRCFGPERLALAASAQHLVAALLQRPSPDAALVDESVAAGRAAAAQDAAAASEGEAARALASSPAPWGAAAAPAAAVVAGFVGRALRCGLSACEAAQSALKSMAGDEAGGGGSWEETEKRIAATGAAVEALVGCIRVTESGAAADALALGGCGAQLVWIFIHHGLGTVLPVALWCCGALPKAGGSGKKVKRGQEALHAARVALRALMSTVQAALSDLHQQLGAAASSASASSSLGASGEIACDIPALAELAGHAARCDEVRREAAEAHEKRLLVLQEAVACRLALVKSRGAFKP